MYEVQFWDHGKLRVLGPYSYSVALKWARKLSEWPHVADVKMMEVK